MSFWFRSLKHYIILLRWLHLPGSVAQVRYEMFLGRQVSGWLDSACWKAGFAQIKKQTHLSHTKHKTCIVLQLEKIFRCRNQLVTGFP